MLTKKNSKPRFRRRSTRRRSSIVAVGLGMLGAGGGSGGAGGTEGGDAGGAAAEPGNGGAALQGQSAPVAQPRKRSSWVSVANVAGRRRSMEPVSAIGYTVLVLVCIGSHILCRAKSIVLLHMYLFRLERIARPPRTDRRLNLIYMCVYLEACNACCADVFHH